MNTVTLPLVARSDLFWPLPGPQTTFCILLGTFDATLIGFLVSRVML